VRDLNLLIYIFAENGESVVESTEVNTSGVVVDNDPLIDNSLTSGDVSSNLSIP